MALQMLFMVEPYSCVVVQTSKRASIYHTSLQSLTRSAITYGCHRQDDIGLKLNPTIREELQTSQS